MLRASGRKFPSSREGCSASSNEGDASADLSGRRKPVVERVDGRKEVRAMVRYVFVSSLDAWRLRPGSVQPAASKPRPNGVSCTFSQAVDRPPRRSGRPLGLASLSGSGVGEPRVRRRPQGLGVLVQKGRSQLAGRELPTSWRASASWLGVVGSLGSLQSAWRRLSFVNRERGGESSNSQAEAKRRNTKGGKRQKTLRRSNRLKTGRCD